MDLSLAAVIFMGGYVVAIMVAGLVMTLRPGGSTFRFAAAAVPTAAAPGRREEILLGGEAEALGNPRGSVQAVRLHPGNLKLQGLELASGFGLLEHQDVPATAIVAADGQVVSLDQTTADHLVDPSSEGVALRRNMPVIAADKQRLGKLQLVCFDLASRTVTALVVVRGRMSRSQRLVPIDRVREVGPRGVVTDVKANEWTSLPAFATDAELRDAVVERLHSDADLQPFHRSLTVDVQDQIVRLRGFVANHAAEARAQQLAQSVPGVLRVESSVVRDDELAAAVRDALTRDPGTSAARVQVSSRFGTLQILGEAPDRATARRIEAVASRLPGVQAVHNMVAVRSGDVAAIR
jgi:osmotically-inducible protein OsmY